MSACCHCRSCNRSRVRTEGLVFAYHGGMPKHAGRIQFLIWCCAGVIAAGVVGAGAPAGAVWQNESDQESDGDQPRVQVEKTALRECVVLLQGGREVTGLLVSHSEDEVVLRIEGIETRFAGSLVRTIRILPPLMERYENMRRLIKDSDLDGRTLLAEWLRAREQYELAMGEVEAVLARDPFHRQARELHSWLKIQVDLLSKQRVMDERDASLSGPSGAERFSQRVDARRRFPLLKPEEINLIKVYEVDLQRPPRIIIKRETIERMIRTHASSHLIPSTSEGRDALFRKRPEEVLELMFKLQARELYREVVIRDHPPAIQKFRGDVHARWLMNACSTEQCHGGAEAGRLQLYNQKINSDQTVYTNMVILDRFKLADGTPLINYAEPARSPLLQMALPRDVSLYPHPDAARTRGSRGWSSVFRSTEDKGFEDAVAWISGMYRPRPEYPIDYEVRPPPDPTTGEVEDIEKLER